MSKEQNRFKLSRNHIYCLLLWVLVVIQGSAQLLAVAIPNHDNSSVDLVNVWIRLGLYPSKNWFGFTTVTVLVGVGIYLYKHLMGEKLTLQRAMPFVKPLLINILLFLEVWDLDEWAAKWTYINENAVSFIVGTLIAVALSVIACTVITNRELSDKFQKEVLPTLENSDEEQKERKPKVRSKSEIEYMIKHPWTYRKLMAELHKSKEKGIKNEIRIQRQEFKKKQDEHAIQIAQVQLETNRKINDEIQEKRIEKAKNVSINDFGDFDTESKKLLSLEPQKNNEEFFTFVIALFLTLAVVFFYFFWGTDNLENVTKYIDGLQKLTEKIEVLEPIFSKMILTSCILVSLIVVLVIIFFACYILIKCFLYIKNKCKTDNKKIQNIVTLIKSFVIGSIYAIMRLLLFIPDFLEVIEAFLLETNLQEKIDEYNKEDK